MPFAQAYSAVLLPMFNWFATTFLHLSAEAMIPEGNGSGDTTYNYVEILFYLVIALPGCVLWSALDRRRPNYSTLAKWGAFFARLYLGTMLISYGTSKVIPEQFPPPDLDRLVETYGASSPMGLLWTFMGASPAYTVFAGLSELIPGVLLFFSRTSVIGALLAMAVMFQVFMLNMCYDVPVKILSFHLLVMAALLVCPYATALWKFLVMRQPSVVPCGDPLFRRAALNKAVLVIQVLAVIYYCCSGLYSNYVSHQEVVEKSPLFGVWSVSEFTTSDTSPLTLDDESRWRSLVFESPKVVLVLKADGSEMYLRSEAAKDTGKIHLFSWEKEGTPSMNYEVGRTDATHLEVVGQDYARTLKARLKKVDDSEFLLTKRGFHWINEQPYNQ